LHFAAPEENQYKYIMEGFDQNWQNVGNRRFVSYTNLTAGNTYTFRVKASNKDGLWNEEGTSVKLTITTSTVENLVGLWDLFNLYSWDAYVVHKLPNL